MEVTAVEVNPGQTGRAGEGNIYEVEERGGGGGGQPHYSLPVRGGRSLPVLYMRHLTFFYPYTSFLISSKLQDCHSRQLSIPDSRDVGGLRSPGA